MINLNNKPRVPFQNSPVYTRWPLLAGALSYTLWGVFPIYFRSIHFASNLEIMVHRVIWSALALTLYLWAVNRDFAFLQILKSAKSIFWSAVSAALIFANWYLFVYAVSSGQTLAASFGYFLNPVLVVLLGTFVFKEKLFHLQWIALSLAILGILIETYALGEFPKLSLALALSFALYGVAKKKSALGPLQGLWLETVLLCPVVLIIAAVMIQSNELVFFNVEFHQKLLLIAAGPVTALPLLLFAAAARSLPFSVMGFLQYLAPTGQLIVARFLFQEDLPEHKIIAFSFVWLGILLLVYNQLKPISQFASNSIPRAKQDKCNGE